MSQDPQRVKSDSKEVGKTSFINALALPLKRRITSSVDGVVDVTARERGSINSIAKSRIGGDAVHRGAVVAVVRENANMGIGRSVLDVVRGLRMHQPNIQDAKCYRVLPFPPNRT